MAIISGELTSLGVAPFEFEPVGQPVFIKQGEDVVGAGEVDRDHQFEIEIPDDVPGQLELVAHVVGAAPLFFEADGSDVALQIMIAHGGSNYLA